MEKENDYLKERIELLEPIVSHSLDVRRGFVETGKMKYAEGNGFTSSIEARQTKTL